MATTITALRENHLNIYLVRQEGALRPWTDTACDRFLTDAITRLWPRLGLWTSGDVATDDTTDTYSLPTGIEKVDEIHLLSSAGEYIDIVRRWKHIPGDKLLIRPRLRTSNTLRIHGWTRFNPNATDLPVDLEPMVAMSAAANAWRALAGELANSQRQQNLPDGRVVSYNEAFAQASYYAESYERELGESSYTMRAGPRMAYP